MFSVPVALVEIFSLKFYIPHFAISFALPQAAEGGLSGITMGHASKKGNCNFSFVSVNRSSSREGPKEAKSYLGGKGAGREGKYCP